MVREMSKALIWTMSIMLVVTAIMLTFLSPAPAQDTCTSLDKIVSQLNVDHAVAEIKPAMLAALKDTLTKRSEGDEPTIVAIKATDQIVVAFGRETVPHVHVFHLAKGCAFASVSVAEADFMATLTEAYGEGFALRNILQPVTSGAGA